MGFRDYYRQFDDFDEFELNRERRERRQREKAARVEQLPELDLSGTEWPDMPHSEIANAAIARARGLVNRYPDRHATAVRRLLAERHEIDPERIVMGNGAAVLLQSAVLFLLGRGDEMLMPWPSYPLYPLLATHAGAQPLACDRGAVLDSITERTRAVVICNPNHPTGEYLPSHALGALLSALPDGGLRACRRGAGGLPRCRGHLRLPAPLGAATTLTCTGRISASRPAQSANSTPSLRAPKSV